MNFLKRGFKAAKSAVNAIFGVRADQAREGQKLQRFRQVHRFGRHTLGDGGAFGFFL